MTPRLGRALREAVGALEELSIDYAIVGGLAVGAWGVPRATRDVDLYAKLASTRHADLQAALERRGFHVPALEEELAKFGVFRSRLVAQKVFVDIFSAAGPLGEAIIARRKRLRVRDEELWFATAEDIVVLKAFSDRPRDHEDLAGLLGLSPGRLDMEYIERWARLLDESIGGNDVSERLDRARKTVRRR